MSEGREPRRGEARRHARPGRRYLRDIPREADRDGLAEPAAAARIRDPSRSEISPPESAVTYANVGSPGRFSAITMPLAPASRARDAFTLYGHPPRLTSATAPRSEPPCAASQSCPFTPAIEPTSTSRWFAEIHDGGTASVGANGIRGARLARRPGSDGPNVRVGDRADADRVRRRRRRPGRPEAEEVPIVAGRDHRTTPARTTFRDGRDEDVRPRIGRDRPPEKLMMSIPSWHGGLERGDDLGAVRGAAAAERRRRGHVEHAVVADVRARRHALDVLDSRVTAAVRLAAEAGLARVDIRLHPGDNAGHERRVERLVAVERSAAGAGPGEAARDYHLRSRRPGRPLREARRYENPVGSRNGCSWSTPSSTTATFTPCPRSPVSAPNCGAPITDGPRLRSRW